MGTGPRLTGLLLVLSVERRGEVAVSTKDSRGGRDSCEGFNLVLVN
jgi:hypothetical protein